MTFTIAKQAFLPAAQLLAQKIATLADRPHVIGSADEMRAVYHTVTRESISLTEGESRHYGSVLAGYARRIKEPKQTVMIERMNAKKKGLPQKEWPIFDVNSVLKPHEVQELNACTELLIRSVMPLIGWAAFQYAEKFGSVGAAFSAAYRETMLALFTFDPMPVKVQDDGSETVSSRAMKLTAYLEDRLIKQERMIAQLQDDDNNRKQQEQASLLMAYLAALELDIYGSHDPESILEGIAYLHGGKYLTHRIVGGKKVPIELAEGEQYPFNPAFLEQHYNTVAKVEKGLQAVHQYRPLSLSYSTNPEIGTLEDTLAAEWNEDKLDQVDMLEDLANLQVLMTDGGFDDERLETINLNAIITAALQHGHVLGDILPQIAAAHSLSQKDTVFLIRHWVPFYRKYADVMDVELPTDEVTAQAAD